MQPRIEMKINKIKTVYGYVLKSQKDKEREDSNFQH